jgi:hypothetical protein
VAIRGLLKRLDDSAFLGFRVWEFSWRSLRTRYGLTFLIRILLRHPIRTLTGMLRYRHLFQSGCQSGDITFLFEGPEEDFVRRLVEREGNLLVAVGFCHKPLTPPCPAGRPNHECLYLNELDLQGGGDGIHDVCRECEINTIGTAALRAGAHMHIMTSALDIARDVMIPSIDHGRFRRIIKCLCPFSTQAIGLPLIICGLEGLLINYASGNCIDYAQWLAADQGIKPEMTVLSAGARERILTLIRARAEHKEREGRRYRRFLREGNIYVSSE